MSVEAMTRVWKLDLPHARQAVLLVMTDHGNDDGESIFPSTGLIGWKCGYSKRQVQRIVDGMEEDGLLVRVAEAHGYRPTEYRVGWDAAQEKPEYKPSKKGRKRRGDNVSPHVGRSDDAPSEASGEGEMSPPGATFPAERGDTQMSPRTLNHQENQTGEAGKPASPSEDRQTASPGPRRELIELSTRLAEGILRNDGKAKVKPESTTWLDPIRLLIDRDGRTVEEVRGVIDYCVTDEFNRKHMHSPAKMRERFTELRMKAIEARMIDPENVGPMKFRRSPAARPPHTVTDCPTAPPELQAEWSLATAELRQSVEESTFNVWLAGLHPHESSAGRLVLGCPPHARVWVRDRFGRLIESAVGRPVEIVGCAGAQEARAA
jgi:hypothetical protein